MPLQISRFWSMVALLALFVVCFATGDAFARNAVTATRLGIHPDGITRFVMDLADGLDFTLTTQADPNRIVINTPSLSWQAANVSNRSFGAVRGVHYEEDVLGGRIILDLKDPALVKSAFVIPPRDGQGWRLVMDLRETTRADFLAHALPGKPGGKMPTPKPEPKVEMAKAPPAPAVPVPQARPIPEPRPAPEPVPEPVSAPVVVEPAPRALVMTSPDVQQVAPQPARKSKPGAAPIMSAPVPPPQIPSMAEKPMPAMAAPEPAPAPVTKVMAPAPQPVEPVEPKQLPADGKAVIVIDPGHGGVDPGAIGVSGIYEKYITLAVARELKEQLEQGGRYKVFLTRDRDVFIRLRDRVAISRQFGADLFISLHADSVANPQLKGLSIYTLSQNASDSEAQALADKENKADLIAGIDLSHESADVANILIDLAQRETMNRSAVFAGDVVTEVGRVTPLLGNSHRFAGFAVLKAPDVPAVLIELGYLSNETEERNLRTPEYREKLAKAVAKSIDRYFVQGQKAKR